MDSRDYSVYSFIKRNAAFYGDRPCLKYEERLVTFREYLNMVDRLAAGLVSIGVEYGDRLAVVASNTPAFLALYGAAAKLGLIVLAVNWRLTPEEVAFILKDGSPRFLFYEAAYDDKLTVYLDGKPSLDGVYDLGQGNGDAPSWETLLKEDDVDEAGVWHSPYVIFHTAAVDVEPRGALLTQGNIMGENLNYLCYWQLGPDDVHLAILPLFHVMGFTMTMAAMQAGALNVILPAFDGDRAAKAVHEDKVTLFGEFPPMLERVLDSAKENGYDLSSLKYVGFIDSPAMIDRFQKETGGAFWSAFGQAETSAFVTFAPYDERPGSAGRPGHLVEISLADDEDNEVALGETGEIRVRGPLVFAGYWNRDEDNEYTLRNGWHHTGDMGALDEDGYLWYKGRSPRKELIKPGGENVYPAEVEKVLVLHETVEEAVVFGVADAKWGEAVRAVCRVGPGAAPSEAEVIEFVGSRIARYKKPKKVIFVEDLPRNKDGAIDRAAVKAEHGDD